jgi:hypothetical protein
LKSLAYLPKHRLQRQWEALELGMVTLDAPVGEDGDRAGEGDRAQVWGYSLLTIGLGNGVCGPEWPTRQRKPSAPRPEKD